MKIEQGLIQTVNSEDDKQCEDKNCNRTIEYSDACFIDSNDSTLYCSQCGKCVKYQRKKQQEREDKGIFETPLIKGLDY